ncbi:MAG: phage terminase large subunit family protein [Eubacterium sp.]|nr:phage terminase large subunit family protein [Eubacterium sp.]
MERKTRELVKGIFKVLKSKKRIKVSEWAEQNMVLPASSAVSGRFSCAAVPYQREIMDAIIDPDVQSVTVMSSAQIGKTTIILILIGYFIEHEPSTIMMVMPTIDTMERFSKSRIASLIDDVKCLKDILGEDSKKSGNTILYKEFAGGYLVCSGANSPASLASTPIRIVLMDEIDKYPDSAGKEGNPIRLAEKRATSYWNKKFFKSSTPSIATQSKIEEEYEKGTMEKWCVQCPCCGTYQPYEWERIDFATVGMKCIDCGEISEEKFWKESDHKWIPGRPEIKNHRSFHLNALASPWTEWQELIDQFNNAMERVKKFHDTEDLKTFYNSVLGETWDDTRVDEKAQSKDELITRAEDYGCEVPDGVIMVTAAVDVQDNRFEVELRGWAREYETWGLYKTEIFGDIEMDDVWHELEQYITQTLEYSDGRKIGVVATAIDTGGSHTESVYRHCKYMLDKGLTIYPVKGFANKEGAKLLYKASRAEVTELLPNGKKIVRDMIPLQILGVDAGKEMIQNRLKIEDPGEGYCHFPDDESRGYDEVYYDGLTSEHKVTTRKNGRLQTKWVKKRGVANEPLDLFNYNLAACMIRNPSWDKLEMKVEKGIDYTQKKPGSVAKRRSRRRTIRGDI